MRVLHRSRVKGAVPTSRSTAHHRTTGGDRSLTLPSSPR
jgi:hypothetical protein